MNPKDVHAFPIPARQTILEQIKECAAVRLVVLRNQQEGGQEALAKSLVSENWIKDTKYNGKEKKIFYEFSCQFQFPKRYITSGTSSPFTLIQINNI